MRRKALAVVAALAAVAAVAASASSRSPSVAVPQSVQAPAKGGALLAVVPGGRGPVLGRADKRALWIGRHSPRLRVFNQVVGWAYADERERVALATEAARESESPLPAIQFIHSFSLQRYGMTKLGSGHVAGIAWGAGSVNVVLDHFCCPASFEVVSIDPDSQKIRSRVRLPNMVLQVARAGDTLVVLAAPPTGLGSALLAVADAGGGVRTVTLDQIVAGRTVAADMETEPDFTTFRQNVPGLAVDPDNGRAFVVPAAGSVAEVSLSSLALSYHAVAQPVSLFGRVHNWLEPKAAAKGLNGPVRMARWLGSGVLAVTGADEAMFKEASGDPRMTWSPAGLTLIDTNSWGSKLIDRGADSFTIGANMLLATGSRWDSQAAADATGMGLAAYRPDGTRALSVLRGRPVSIALAFGARAYLAAGSASRLKVVDLASGKLLKDRRAPLAQLLIGDGST